MTIVHDIDELQKFSDSAWETLQSDFHRRIYFYVKKYVGNHQTAEDITQDVFLGAVRGMPNFDRAYSIEQFLFGIARNRVIDHYRKHKTVSLPAKSDGTDRNQIWLENMPEEDAVTPDREAVDRENQVRQRKVMGDVLKDFFGRLWEAGEFQKLMILEYLFVLGARNKDCAVRFGIEDEKAIAGIKFRAIDKLRGLARQRDPNHSLFIGLWKPGSR